MLLHSFDGFYVVTRFALPTIKDLKFSQIKFDSNCSYLDVDVNKSKFPTQYLPNIKNFCKDVVPFIYFKRNKLIIIIEQHMKF